MSTLRFEWDEQRAHERDAAVWSPPGYWNRMKHGTADPANALHKRAVLAIAAATGSTSLLVNVWLPFLPLYMLQVGARDEPAALFWVAVGMSAQGVGRLIGGPLWGLLSDRLGRKKMFVRAVYSAALTAFVLSIISAPWQVAIALALHGLLSGFIPAAVALTSVSVPTQRSGCPEHCLRRPVPGQRDRTGGRCGHGDRIRLSRRDLLLRAADSHGGDSGHFLVPADTIRRSATAQVPQSHWCLSG
jgi:hypothetical protein